MSKAIRAGASSLAVLATMCIGIPAISAEEGSQPDESMVAEAKALREEAGELNAEAEALRDEADSLLYEAAEILGEEVEFADEEEDYGYDTTDDEGIAAETEQVESVNEESVVDAAEEESEDDSVLEEEDIRIARTAPVASRSYTFAELESRGVHGLSDMVAADVGGLLIQPSAFNSSNLGLSLRGMSATAPHQATGESAVGVFIDGTYIARSQGLSLDLLDIESVEVLRGSQGVLGGRNTTGGAVYLSSGRPTGEFGVEQKLQFGDVGDEVTSITHLNLPKFADILSTKVSYLVHNHDGWVDNELGSSSTPAAGGTNNFWGRDNKGARVAIRLEQGGPFTYDYSYLNGEVKSTTPYLQVIAAESSFQDATRSLIELPESEVDISHHNQIVTVRGDNTVVTATVSFREVESKEFYNFDSVLGIGVPAVLDSANRLEQEQFSQELKLESFFFDGAFDLTVGFQNFNERVDLIEESAQGNTDVDSQGIFAQGVWSVGDMLELTAGWRETADDKKFKSLLLNGTGTAVEIDTDDSNTDIQLSALLNIIEGVSAHVSYATGFKSGGASLLTDTLATLPRAFRPYEAETTKTLEVGADLSFLNETLKASLSAFSTDISDRQVEIIDPNNVRFSDVVNDGSTNTITGIEVDFRVVPVEWLAISGFYSYLDTESSTVLDPYDASETLIAKVAMAPRHSGSAALDFSWGEFEGGAVKLHVEYTGSSKYQFDTLNPQAGSKDVFNARLSISGITLDNTSGQMEVGIWVNNLAQDEYLTTGHYVNRSGPTPYTTGAFGEPRTFGIDLRYLH